MQIETANQVTKSDLSSSLRVASISSEKASFSFLYVGGYNECIKTLSAAFRSGLITENFTEAGKLIESDELEQSGVDVVIIDTPFDEEALRSFTAFLKKTSKISLDTPILYNTYHLKEVAPDVIRRYVDDVVDIRNWHYDFEKKINVIRNAKRQLTAASGRIRVQTCYYKRAFDILASVTLLLMLLPVFVLIAIAIRLESRGPIFYNARRAGRGFRIFRFYKFRTMVVNADKKIDALAHLNQYQGAAAARFFKIANDPRVTKVGKFLRNTSLDELPQLFNVLRGDMSLVGNRPLPLYEAATLTTNDYVERFMAPAGITGLWQIKKRGQANMSIDERIHLDISYARKSNLLFDFWIMANTPKALIQKSDV